MLQECVRDPARKGKSLPSPLLDPRSFYDFMPVTDKGEALVVRCAEQIDPQAEPLSDFMNGDGRMQFAP